MLFSLSEAAGVAGLPYALDAAEAALSKYAQVRRDPLGSLFAALDGISCSTRTSTRSASS